MLARGEDPDSSTALRCPSCGMIAPPPERFCPDCGLPLTLPGAEDVVAADARHARARKIKPQLAEGPLVRVAGARNQAEGEMLQGLLLEAGVPSLLRRSAGFDVPDFLAAGPRDVMVPQSGAVTAREVLLEAQLVSDEPLRPVTQPARLLIGLLGGIGLVAVVIWVGTLIVH